MTTSDQIHEIATALAKAQGDIKGAGKSASNPFFKSKYADLASVWEACRSPLSANGLAVIQSPSLAGMTVTVTTLLIHSSGQWIRGEASCVAKDDSPQSVGSAITYLRRYALQSFAGVAPEDDDAEAAQGRGKTMPGMTSTAQIAARLTAPVGYSAWLEGLTDVLPEGTAALEKAWKASKPEFRRYLTDTDPKLWESMKQSAADKRSVFENKLPA